MKRKRRVPFIFDMRGFWADERVESGDWSLSSPLYRAVYAFFKNRETVLLEQANHVVSLTHSAAAQIASRPTRTGPTSIIPCCVDFAHFRLGDLEGRAASRRILGIPDRHAVLLYLGSLGGNHLLDEMMRFYASYRADRGASTFLVITHSPADLVRDAAQRCRIALEELVIRSARRDEVPGLVAAADHGVAFKRPAFSALACSPTKLGELLACGVPTVVNRGVGDVAAVVAATAGGACVDDFGETELARASRALAQARTGPELREAAAALFDLDAGVRAYDGIYVQIGAVAPHDASVPSGRTAGVAS